MTQDHNIKREIRARMRVTGERYTEARAALLDVSMAARPGRGLILERTS